jgi:DNA-binding CsgD family transcriptional regulator
MLVFSDAGQNNRRLVQPTTREIQVLYYVACGLENKLVSHELSITVRTVKGYVGAWILALGVANRAQLIRWAHLHPEVFEGNAVETTIHAPDCECNHPLCVRMRAWRSKVA